MPDKDNLDTSVEGANVAPGVSGQCEISPAIKEMSGFTDALMTSRELAAEDPRLLQAEIERLRAVLESIATAIGASCHVNCDPKGCCAHRSLISARAALEPRP